MTNSASEQARPVLRLRWLLAFCIALFMANTPSRATDCSCRDPIPADSSGPGTCTKTQSGKQSCKLDWNSGGNREQNASVSNELQKLGIRVPDVGGVGDDEFDRAATTLLAPPNPNTTVQAMATLIAGALARNAPDRIGLYGAFLSKYNDIRFNSLFASSDSKIERDQLSVEGRNYNVAITLGCVLFQDGQFLLVLKTRYARARRDCDESAR